MGVTDLIQNKSVVYFNQKYNIAKFAKFADGGGWEKVSKIMKIC